MRRMPTRRDARTLAAREPTLAFKPERRDRAAFGGSGETAASRAAEVSARIYAPGTAGKSVAIFFSWRWRLERESAGKCGKVRENGEKIVGESVRRRRRRRRGASLLRESELEWTFVRESNVSVIERGSQSGPATWGERSGFELRGARPDPGGEPAARGAPGGPHLSSHLPLVEIPTSTDSGRRTNAESSRQNFERPPVMAAATPLFPNSLAPFSTNPSSASPSPRLARPPFPARFERPPPPLRPRKRDAAAPPARATKKKNPWLDPFDDGEDPDMEYGSLFADGKQEEDPRPPDNPDSPYGFLKFPMGYNVEIASLAQKVRGDVRRCCCVVSGGVYENLLFFPAIQLIKDRYPGVQVDVVASARGKQAYELNKNVRWANVYDPDDDFPEPGDYVDMIGLLKSRYYDLVLSTKLAGLGHASFLFMTSAHDRVSYIYPDVNAAGAGLLLSETFTAESANLSDGGYNMYQQMVDWLGRPFRSVPRHPVPPLKVSISKKLKEVVAGKVRNAGAEKGKYVVIHGLESDSKASMQSRGDTDSLLPLTLWAEITEGIRGVRPIFVIPHERERENVEEIIGEDASIVFMTTPGQLAALINDSVGVIATNTAAIQLANAREKPSIALFSSEVKARLFIPNPEEKKCTVVYSKTGKLIDVDVEAVKKSMQIFDVSLALA